MTNLQSNKQTSFHAIALNIVYVAILSICHFSIPYIYEIAYAFFNSIFLIISIVLFFYLNAVLRTSSITRLSYLSLFFRIIVSILLFLVSITFLAFLTNTTEIIDRSEFLRFLIALCSLSVLAMVSVKYIYSIIKPNNEPYIILLTDNDSLDDLEADYFSPNSNTNVKKFDLNEIDSLIYFAEDHGVPSVYISVSSQNLNTIEALVKNLSQYAFNLYWILPNSFFAENSSTPFLKPILLNGSPVSLDTNQYLLKRSLDVVGSILSLILISPLILLIAFFIKISDGGTIFYRQLRHGQYGKEFNMLKFRSMAKGSDYTDKPVTIDDPRVTMIGKMIRKTSLDEIPQLLNVLKGEMSLVGPRPHIISETHLYSKNILRFLSRHQVKPGITGLAQIRTRGKTDSVDLMQDKLSSDLEYINNWSIYMDLTIILSTPLSLWKNKDTNI
jgi:putative colanic acid biosysnthesis UDP-glucose lipid carrier transferase